MQKKIKAYYKIECYKFVSWNLPHVSLLSPRGIRKSSMWRREALLMVCTHDNFPSGPCPEFLREGAARGKTIPVSPCKLWRG